MLSRTLITVAWVMWGVLVIAALCGLFRVATDRATSPEVGRGLGVLVVVVVLALLAGAGVLLRAAARSESRAGLVAIGVMLVWPVFVLIATPIVKAYKEWRLASGEARSGDFRDAALAAMARAIDQGDTATLSRLLAGGPPGAGKDREGNDLLAYALVVIRDRGGSASLARALLEAGADPRQTRMANGQTVLHFMVTVPSAEGHETMRALLVHGADPNAVQPEGVDTPLGTVSNDPAMVRLLVEHGADIDHRQHNGVPAVVRFIAQQDWESALYLIEKGANLDLANADGLSVDYYLKDWRESVHGENPAGWERVREAIAARRAIRH